MQTASPAVSLIPFFLGYSWLFCIPKSANRNSTHHFDVLSNKLQQFYRRLFNPRTPMMRFLAPIYVCMYMRELAVFPRNFFLVLEFRRHVVLLYRTWFNDGYIPINIRIILPQDCGKYI